MLLTREDGVGLRREKHPSATAGANFSVVRGQGFRDIYLPEGKENFVRVALKEEHSKTLGRTVASDWQRSIEAVKAFLAERIAVGIKPADPVFEGSYDAMKKCLQRLGLRTLKRQQWSVSPNMPGRPMPSAMRPA